MKNLRNKLGITQQELSDYLQVERSILTRHESGDKRMPYAAMQKLRVLEIAVNQKHNDELSITAAQSIQKIAETSGKKIKREKNSLLAKLAKTERELQRMKNKYEALVKALPVINHLQQHIPTEDKSDGDKHLLHMMEKKALKKLAPCNPAVQAILNARLKGYEAMIAALDEVKK
jgi:predicted transcriptional regulator